jgi:hypothetical protein
MYEGGRIDIPARVLCRIAQILKVPVGKLIRPNGDAVTSQSQERGSLEWSLIPHVLTPKPLTLCWRHASAPSIS